MLPGYEETQRAFGVMADKWQTACSKCRRKTRTFIFFANCVTFLKYSRARILLANNLMSLFSIIVTTRDCFDFHKTVF